VPTKANVSIISLGGSMNANKIDYVSALAGFSTQKVG
jgi:hypothetical protein